MNADLTVDHTIDLRAHYVLNSPHRHITNHAVYYLQDASVVETLSQVLSFSDAVQNISPLFIDFVLDEAFEDVTSTNK